jgi:hypothetical protein
LNLSNNLKTSFNTLALFPVFIYTLPKVSKTKSEYLLPIMFLVPPNKDPYLIKLSIF